MPPEKEKKLNSYHLVNFEVIEAPKRGDQQTTKKLKYVHEKIQMSKQ